MKDKKIMIIGIVLAFVFLSLLVFYLLGHRDNTMYVYFDSDGGTVVEKIAIKKGDTVNLPTTKKDGYVFSGWYKGDIKVNNSTKYYETTTLFASWIKEGAQTFTITFDSDGGSEVENLIIECDKELKLPINPTKEGYEFISWIDKNETPILDKALLACEDIILKANWKKIEEKKEETKEKETIKEVKYSCPNGYTLSGTKCIIEANVKEKCPDNSKVDGELCINTSDYNTGTRICKIETVILDNNGHTDTLEGEYYQAPGGYGVCGYHIYIEYNNSSDCTSSSTRNAVWANNKCYAKTIVGNYTTQCSSDYKYYSSEELSSKFGLHNDGKCLKIVNKINYCDNDYTLTNDKCIKTIDATTN